MEVFGRSMPPGDLRRHTGDTASVGGLRHVVYENGPERGVRAVELRSSVGLELEVLLDRAFDLGSARFRGQPFGWRSGNGFRHPGLHEHNDEGGLSWLRALDGLLVTGGLDHTLFGETVDASHYRYPPKQDLTHGLHGRVAMTPGRLLEAREIWDGDAAVLRVRGEVIQATSFGEHLRMTRTIEMDFDGREVVLHDVVDNLGFETTPHMYLYHLNFGWPLVAEGTRFVAPIARHVWESDSVSRQGAPYHTITAPQRGFVEQVMEHELVADDAGNHAVALVTDAGDFGVEVEWDASAMPCFFEWLNLREGQYAVGLEPSTHHVAGELAARDDGSMIWLDHGESRTYRTRIKVLTDRNQVVDMTARIRGVHGQPG